MSTTRAQRTIDAPVELVFATVSDIRNFSQAVPHIVDVEFLSEQQSGVGTRFRETRLMGKRKASSVLEVTEWSENESVRYVSDQGGTIWDTVFRVRDTGAGTELSLTMEARAYRWLARCFNPLIRGMVAKAIEGDMDAIKSYCEGSR